ncbi:MAG TPA: DNA-3-methyladenine glycosylase I [Nitrospirota bacterium]|nr:DNA-3-methyladenine glycosylase I [Nitrospirota bacterium]
MKRSVKRCPWPADDPLMIAYHDTEWGVPLHDDRKLYEFIVLDGAQAGLSWSTVLRKRENYREAFRGFDPKLVARFTPRDVERLLKNTGIIRNRLKIESAVINARRFLDVRKEFGSFDAYIWQFTGGRTLQHRCRRLSDIPTTSRESDAMSRDMKKRGFTFVGSTICYAFMQAAGMVNDHLVDCFRYRNLGDRTFTRDIWER